MSSPATMTPTQADESRHCNGVQNPDALGEATAPTRTPSLPALSAEGWEDIRLHPLAAWNANLSEAQTKALYALLAGATTAQAAADAGVCRQTVSYWRNREPDFRHALSVARCECHAEALDRLRALTATALDLLSGLLHDPKADPALRMRAALALVTRLPALAPPSPTSRWARSIEDMLDPM